MLFPVFFYVLLGMTLFYLHQLFLYPQVSLRPLAPLLLYAGLKEPLAPAFAAAVFLGALQDSYALSPFGIHLLNSLLIVGLARLARETLWMKNAPFLFLTMAVVLLLQDLGTRLLLAFLGSAGIFSFHLTWPFASEILVTALVTPVFFNLFRTLEFQGRRLKKPGGPPSSG